METRKARTIIHQGLDKSLKEDSFGTAFSDVIRFV